jgi:hypothetical protein
MERKSRRLLYAVRLPLVLWRNSRPAWLLAIVASAGCRPEPTAPPAPCPFATAELDYALGFDGDSAALGGVVVAGRTVTPR